MSVIVTKKYPNTWKNETRIKATKNSTVKILLYQNSHDLFIVFIRKTLP